MIYIQYMPQSRGKVKNGVYQPHNNNIHQLYNTCAVVIKLALPPPCADSVLYGVATRSCGSDCIHKQHIKLLVLTSGVTKLQDFPLFIYSFVHSIWHVQNATTPCRSQEVLSFLSVM
jgi:hypothetical protein